MYSLQIAQDSPFRTVVVVVDYMSMGSSLVYTIQSFIHHNIVNAYMYGTHVSSRLTAHVCLACCSQGAAAYAIVMSGGYRDDKDDGIEIDYTGEGGQTKGKHVRPLFV